MAGSPWQFTLLPDSINTVTITDGSTTVTVNRGSSTFRTGAFVETTVVTISAAGYNDLTNITVGDTNLVMTPVQTKPEHLYGWTDPSTSSETLYAWTIESGASINNGGITTIYTKTPDPILDTSTGNFTELFDKDGNSYGKDRSDLMSWTLTNTSGKTMGETYVNSMSSSTITLTAIGPA